MADQEPKLFIIIDYAPPFNGHVQYVEHFVAAFSSEDAERRFHARGIATNNAYITTDSFVNGKSVIVRARQSIEAEARPLSEGEFRRWERVCSESNPMYRKLQRPEADHE